MTDGLNSESFMTDGLMTEGATTDVPPLILTVSICVTDNAVLEKVNIVVSKNRHVQIVEI